MSLPSLVPLPGFEPRLTVRETAVLPLHHRGLAGDLGLEPRLNGPKNHRATITLISTGNRGFEPRKAALETAGLPLA